MENKSARALTCPECGGDFSASDLLDGDSVVTCLGCGKKFSTSEIFHQSTDEKVEEIRARAYTDVEKDRTKAYKEVEQGKQKLEYEKIKHENDKAEKTEKEKEIAIFKKSKFRKVLIVFIVISIFMTIGAFNNQKVLAGIVASAMIVLFSLAFLMGNNVITEKKKNFRLVPAILAFVLFIPYGVLNVGLDGLQSGESFEWSEVTLSECLPEPAKTYGEIISNSDDYLCIDICDISEKDYKNYVGSCKEFGYTIDAENTSFSYEAYNNIGYKLRIHYSDYSDEYTIYLYAPVKNNDIVWANIEIMKYLPTPTSNKGEISYEYNTSFSVSVLNITKEAYDAYVIECMNKGFTIDYSKGDTYFRGNNSDDYYVSLEYEGFNTMSIYIKKN